MENKSDYDLYLSHRRSLTIISFCVNGFILILCSTMLWKLNFELKVNFLIIMAAISFIGLSMTYIKKKKLSLMHHFAETFEIDLENNIDEFYKTIALYKKGEFEKIEAAFTNKKHTRTRGFDEKGLTGGKQSSSLDKQNQRIDAMKNTDYDDIAGDITAGEVLRREADQRYAKISEERWEKSEAEDKDLIEAGVGKLGDLARTDWLEKNAKDGAVRELYRNEDES